tara:strand:- start:3386 stop:3784 length:399 start_codon:yes stop_codon:yes gene_type:complete
MTYKIIGLGVVLNKENKVLIDRRLNQGMFGGFWEFPGGKKEPNESIQETIKREIKEELMIEVDVGDHLISIDHSYSHKQLHFIVHLCTLITGKPIPIVSQEVRWVNVEELDSYQFPEANFKIISQLANYLKE